LIAVSDSGNINKYDTSTNSFIEFSTLPESALDIRATGNYLIVTTAASVYVYGEQLSLVRQINNVQVTGYSPVFTCATSINDVLYIGTKENGLLTTTIVMASAFENITPMGPSRNNIFAFQTTSNSLWAVYGDYDATYNPYGLDSYGISKFSQDGWLNIPYASVLGAKSICRITVNPNKEEEVYASSFFSGLLKIDADKPTLLYNQTNSGLESLTFAGPNYIDIRINGAAFDKTETSG
jgi:hypothetical protein